MDEALESYYRSLLENVPTGPVGHPDFVFDASSVGPLPPVLHTENLFVRVGLHIYSDSYRPDLIDIFLGRTTARSLGCLVLSTLLHGGSSRLELRRPESEAKQLIVEFEHPAASDPPVGLSLTPFAVRYFPADEARHPWKDSVADPYDLPWFEFTNQNRMAVSEEQHNTRDTVIISGTVGGLARYGELLLNAGRPEAQCAEFNLEGEAGGFRGVAPGGAEVRLWLPGSIVWSSVDLGLVAE